MLNNAHQEELLTEQIKHYQTSVLLEQVLHQVWVLTNNLPGEIEVN